MAFEWDVFFAGKEGFEEHIQVKSEDADSFESGRQAVLTVLVKSGATTRFSSSKGTGGSPQAMAAAAEAVGVTPAAKNCPNGCAEPMRYKAAGVSRTSGKRYGAFYSCGRCQKTVNAD